MTASNRQLKNEKLLTVKDVARILAVGKSSVYRMVEKRVIPFYKIRSGLRFSKEHVTAYLDSCEIEAVGNEHKYGSKKDVR